MMKINATLIACTFAVMMGCGGPDHVSVLPKPTCIDMMSTCEFYANREASSYAAYYGRIRDCSYDYGKCVVRHHVPFECDEICQDALVASECEFSCRNALIETTTLAH